MHSNKLSQTVFFALSAMIATVLVTECLMNLTPPISRDALIHHLAIPKLWLFQGGFYEMPWAKYSYYPMNIDLLYLIALYVGNDIAPKFIHFAFGLGTGVLVYWYLKEKFGKTWGMLGMTIFLTTPIIVRLSTSAYVDLGMCFFTTAGILCFIKWRDSGYHATRWFVFSSFLMGLALGSKYNALVPFFFLNMMVVYCYAKDTQNQLKAMKQGFVYFLICILVASPWLIKNWVLTKNPFYPLFPGVFSFLQDGGTTLIDTARTGTSGFFHRRQLMFGETFIETLFIPIRMFFQGKDNTYQYFDGVLNPILILFIPFSLTKKDLWKDKIFFCAFSLFSILMAFFLTKKQVRYVAFVLPFLSILSVMGIKNLLTWTIPQGLWPNFQRSRSARFHPAFYWAGLWTLVAGIALLLLPNFVYLKESFQSLSPMNHILKRETRETFLGRHLKSFQAMQYINDYTSHEARIFLMFVGSQGYYIERDYYHDPSFGMKTLKALVDSCHSDDAFRTRLKSLYCTHILARDDLFEKYLGDNFRPDEIIGFQALKDQYWIPIHRSNGYTVYELPLYNS